MKRQTISRAKQDNSNQPLGRERIVQAALDMLNEVGLHQLTMRRLAESLGIRAASLYWHVRDKAELMQLLADNICGRIVLPNQSLPWQKQVVLICNEYRAVLLSIRDSAEIMVDTPPATPRRFRVIESMFRILTSAGFSPEEVTWAANLINNYVLSFVMDEMVARLADEQVNSVEEVRNDARRIFESLPPDNYPLLAGSLAEYAVNPDMNKQFKFGLQVLLDGLAARLKNTTDNG